MDHRAGLGILAGASIVRSDQGATMADLVSNYRSDAILAWETGATMPAAPANLYVGLLTAMPTKSDGTGMVEVAGNGYARVQVTPAQWAAIVSNGDNVTRQSSTNVDTLFPTSSGAWGTITGTAIFDASSGGHWLRASDLIGGSQAIGSNVTYKLPSGQLTRQEA